MMKIDDLRAAIELIEKGGSASDGCRTSFENGGLGEEGAYGENREAAALSDGKGASKTDERDKAFSKIIRLASRAEKSTKQLRERLLRDGFDAADAEEAIERACSCGLVDDARYAEWLVRCRVRQGRGLSGIERELAEIGYSLDDIPGWPDELGYESNEVDRAIAFLDSHPPHSKNVRASAYRKLVSKGFSSDCASSASRIWSDNREQ